MSNPEEQLHKAVWDILGEIKQEALVTSEDEWIFISTPSDEQRRAVRYLVKLGAIKAIEHAPVGPASTLKLIQQMNGQMYKPNSYRIEVLQPKFDEIYKQYQNPQTILPKNDRLPYKKDGLFYSLWKYAHASKLTEKNLIRLTDLTPLEGNERFAVFEFLNAIKELDIELEHITFHEEIYKKYCKVEYDIVTTYIAKNPSTDFSKTITHLFRNEATFNDLYRLLGTFGELAKAKLQLNGILEFTEFSSSPSVQNIAPLKQHLDTYIHAFTKDKLFSPELKNFYRFARQKEIFVYNIERSVKDYGLEFVFRQGSAVSIRQGIGISIEEDESYLFIHTLAALEKQGYFEVESILITDMDVPPEKQTDDYKVKITAADKLADEIDRQTVYTLASTKAEQDSATNQSTNNIGASPINVPYRPNQRNRLSFFPTSGDVEFNMETAVVTSGHKDYALLSLLSQSKNTPFTVQDIQDNCNSLVNNPAYQFKGEKDIDDTLRQIRFKLKVKKGAYFPIAKRGAKGNKQWIWIEK